LSADPAVGLGQIEAADPAFDLELFKRQAVETYLAVKQAIEARDLTDVVDQLSDRVYDDLRLDVEGLLARDAVPHFDGFAPSQVVVVAAERGPQGDVITLRIQAVAMELPGAFTEFWTFSRPLEATTPAARPNECPNCGAPIDVDTGRICHYCKTLLPAPHAQTGWVVAAIRPAQESVS
jgi:inner membrane protein import complex subunit Tim44-like protein